MIPVEIAARSALVLEIQPARPLSADNLDTLPDPDLDRLLAALSAQSLPLSALAQVIVTHDGSHPPAALERLQQAAGRELRFVQVDPQLQGFEAKYMGFFAVDARRCDWVAFSDSGSQPSPGWLQALLQPFGRRQPPAAVAGRTSYDQRLAGIALTTLDYRYRPATQRPGDVHDLCLNNAALRCDVFGRLARQAQAGADGTQDRLLSLALGEAGLRILEAAQAHSVQHRATGAGGMLRDRWRQGRTAVGLVPHLARARLPSALQGVARSGPLAPMALLGLRTVAGLRVLNHQSLPPVRGLRRMAAWGLILGASTVEMTSALVHGLGVLGRAPQAPRRTRGLPPTDFASSRLS